MNATAADASAAPDADASPPAPAAAAWEQALDAARTLLDAARGFAGALAALVASELRLARATLPLFIAGCVLLLVLALSAWVSLVALLGYAFYALTASLGAALLLLTASHALLLALCIGLLRRGLRLLTLPGTRAELGALLRAPPRRADRGAS
ncbi:MAG: hypothetical protein ABFC67_12595 [Mizugakiibacter sp.]|uniref:hypothetical protein n=1 Tax=Mizugakiibacter sp. TaxID=1972610 RepID=UPI0031C212D9|nr:hypothetical protein [Xanthomonadaceae bacterium]